MTGGVQHETFSHDFSTTKLDLYFIFILTPSEIVVLSIPMHTSTLVGFPFGIASWSPRLTWQKQAPRLVLERNPSWSLCGKNICAGVELESRSECSRKARRPPLMDEASNRVRTQQRFAASAFSTNTNLTCMTVSIVQSKPEQRGIRSWVRWIIGMFDAPLWLNPHEGQIT